MSNRKKNPSGHPNDFSGKQNAGSDNSKKLRNLDSLKLPIEFHWDLPETKKKPPFLKRMSFSLSKSSTFQHLFRGVPVPKEEHIVKSLRELLIANDELPEKHDNYHTLLRFLRMSAFDVMKAKELFLNMVKWREDCNVESISKELNFTEYAKVKKFYPHGFHGVDKYGRPLYIDRVGLMDLKSLLQVTTIDRFIKYHISEQEKTLNLRYPACSLVAKRHIASTTAIMDVTGVGINSFSKPARELFIEIQKIDSNYYPETLHRLFIVNAGPAFKVLWKVVSAFMEPRTLAKIQVFGSNYRSELIKLVDPSHLPKFLGGECTCSDTGGCLMEDKGPWNDPETKHILQEIFAKGKKRFNETASNGVFECSEAILGQQITKKSRTLRSLLEDSPARIDRKDVGDGSDDMDQSLELENFPSETKKVLEKLISNQKELADGVKQLKQLTVVLESLISNQQELANGIKQLEQWTSVRAS